ncbi:MAG: type VI secretion system ATPase TssH [Gemmataceae bacterium]|nr:type VI secretion system ATPase TssH [Gemmataceae bacterium]MCI0739935.1 type VI secretion system ATPase TssH [Gemmataceae bacterium]
MAQLNLKALVGKLNATCRRALEAAAGLCLSRTNYNVELEHWLLKLLEPTDTDLPRVLKHYDVDKSKVVRELTRSLDQLRTGNARPPELSLEILDLMREAWVLASLEYRAGRIRSGYLLAALLADRNLSARIQKASPELIKISGEKLHAEVSALVTGSSEDQAAPGETVAEDTGPRPTGDSKTPALDQFTMDLTARAKKGEIDPVVGRDFEIRQVIDILMRRRQNNPILTGEAGVGKTAVVEGFALQVVQGDVPPPLRNVAVRTLDLGLLQAGAGVKGEFENRLKSVIAEVKASPQPIILFIDEAHTIIGAGGAAGQGDAANLLKPALARGELRTIAATTWMEYKKFFETDPALKRRFQLVKVDEPDVPKAIRMMRSLSDILEKHHKVRVLDEAVAEAVKLSHRYITDRQLPDKCVSLLDTACSRVALSQGSVPPAIGDCRREIEHLDIEIASLERESAIGADHQHRLQELKEKKDQVQTRLAALEKRWEKEKELVAKIHEVRGKLEKHIQSASDGKKSPDGAKQADAKPADRLKPEEEQRCRDDLAAFESELITLQGEEPLVLPVVAGQAIAEVVSGWTGVPVGKMVRDEIKTVLALKEKLEERIVGQSHALEAITQRIRTSRANLTDPRRPIGVFMLVGPSGVGKTETAVALAEILFGGDRNMVVINMSEYKEDHKISRLTGSAPGYVGYGEGGVLTEAVRRKPYCIVLLDEVEKANVAVQEIFYQVFDKGMLQDDKGNEVNFKNTIILLTSNVGTDTIMKVCADPDTRPDAAGLAEALRPDLLKSFKPALLGRINIVPFFPLGDEVLKRIIKLQLKRIGDRIRENHKAQFSYDDALVSTISSRCKEVESGARNVDHILTGTLLPEIAGEFLSHMAEGKPVTRAHVSVTPEGKFQYTVE